MKLQTVVLLGFALTTFGACTDFLTENLKGNFSSETFYQNDKQAIQALTGVYNSIAFNNSNNNLWVFGDIASDDAVKGGNPGDQSEITFIDEFNADSNNGIISNYWGFTYEGIARANNVLANVPAVPMDDGLKNRILGEAKFIRAYSYFNLVNIFGKVPLKLLPQLSHETIHVPLSEVAGIYLQIEKDLTEAAAALPVSYSSTDIGRVTKGAALAMLGKVSLFQQKWAAAATYFQQVEDLKIYSLLPDYANNFKLAHENSSESIFEIQHLSGQNPFAGSALNQWFAPSSEGGYYFNAPTQSLVNAFERSTTDEVDPRLDASVGRDGQPWLNDDLFSASWSPTGYLTKKHQQPLSEISSSLKGDGDLNYIYLRYADVLLMKAEAYNETGNADLAKANLNKVRQRARASFKGTPPADLLADITTSDQNGLRTAIQKERRVELAQEYHRYFDLTRWGKTIAEAALGADFNYETKRYFPIPQAEVDANQAINP
ncbi:MAG: RagB/SusD family nutrient uptake outer membrane protein [Bacteroidota bacterium]|nr:RagB/SusD family nutrient uptake outer membrane protein [Odoribacter sp.]MDP3643344.1 RagB/SusD family nutrient uptake outer membrane protein [Bacteroidota bacterium]